MHIDLHIRTAKKYLFSELITSLNQATKKYDNIIVMGDLDIDTLKNGADTNHYLSDLYDTFSSNVNEGNKAVLFFFTKRFHTQKKHKKQKKKVTFTQMFFMRSQSTKRTNT